MIFNPLTPEQLEDLKLTDKQLEYLDLIQNHNVNGVPFNSGKISKDMQFEIDLIKNRN